MKKLLKSEICGSMNNARDPHMAENWLKSQTFRLKKKKKGEMQTCIWDAQNVLPKRTLSAIHSGGSLFKVGWSW